MKFWNFSRNSDEMLSACISLCYVVGYDTREQSLVPMYRVYYVSTDENVCIYMKGCMLYKEEGLRLFVFVIR